MRLAVATALAAWLAASPVRAADQPIRVGVLAFGSVQWEIDTIRAEGLDAARGVDVVPVVTAGKDGATVALQGGTVDAIVTDWLWVSRQRAMGRDYTFIPWSTMTGALLVPAGSPARSLADLAGKRIGVAGGPLDKSWLLLRALAAKEGFDLGHKAEAVFGAPPLLAAQFQAGRLDALVTFWQSALPLESAGARRLVDVAGIPGQLGIASNPPLLGWVFRRDWADAHADAVRAFVAAESAARGLLCSYSGGWWQRLDPLTHAADDATREALRHGFCAGIPAAWGDRERADAVRLFHVLAEMGGSDLVGPSPELQDGTFWPGLRY